MRSSRIMTQPDPQSRRLTNGFAPATGPTLFANQIVDTGLMRAVDRINDRFGRGTVGLGLSEKAAAWRMRQEQLSLHYTTRWQDIPSARLDVGI